MAKRINMELHVKDKGTPTVKKFSSATMSVMKNLAGPLAAGAVVASFVKIARETINLGDKLHKMNLQLGISVNELDRLRRVGELSGVSFEQLTTAIRMMAKNLNDAAGGTGLAKDALMELRLDAQKLMELDPADAFKIIAEEISNIENPTKKAALAMEIFGRSGASVVQMGKDLTKEVSKMTSAMNLEKATQMARFNDTLVLMKWTLQDLATNILPPLIEQFLILEPKIREFMSTFGMGLESQLDQTKTRLQEVTDELIEIEKKGFKFDFLGVREQRYKNLFQELDFLRREEKRLLAIREKIAKLKPSRADLAPGAQPIKAEPFKELERLEKMSLEQFNADKLQMEQDYQVELLNLRGEFREADLLAEKHRYQAELQEAKRVGVKLETVEMNHRLRVLSINKQYDDLEIEQEKEKLEKIDSELEKFFREVEEEQERLAEEQKRMVEEVSDFFASHFTDAFLEIVNGTKSVSDGFKEMTVAILKDLQRMLASKAFQELLNLAFSSFGGGGGGGGGFFSFLGFQHGGTAQGGRPIVVGEGGPELFIPGQTGQVVPNKQLGGTVNQSVTVNVTSQGGAGNEAENQRLGRIISEQVKDQMRSLMMDEQRYGGVLNSRRKAY